jgi:antitoxin Phd
MRRAKASVTWDRQARRQEPPASYTATEAKNEFGRILEKAIQGQTIVITRHETPKAVLISMDEFNALKHAPERKLNTLSAEFDALLARMQTPQARAGMKGAFGASPKQLGKAAVLAAQRRG